MPLILCTIFFILPFFSEYLMYAAEAEEEKLRLQRYHQLEYARYHKRDSYLDSEAN